MRRAWVISSLREARQRRLRRGLGTLCLAGLAACAPHYRYDTLGTGSAGGTGVTLQAAGEHRVDWKVSVPRAMQVAWTLDCGGTETTGTTGESFDQYKARRLAELKKQKDDEKSAVSSIAGAIGGAAKVETPTGDATATAQVNGDAVADAVVSDDVQLPAGDVGANVYAGSTMIAAVAPGACTMQVVPVDVAVDATGMYAQFQVTRVVDLVAERDAARAKARDGAVALRGSISASLVTQGADPEARVRAQAAAEAKAQAELAARAAADQARQQAEWNAQAAAQAQANARAQAQAQVEIDLRGRAQGARSAEIGFLVAGGADPQYRARIAQAQADAQARAQAQADARWQIEIDVRARLVAWLVSGGADPQYRARLAAASAAAQATADARAQAEYDAQARAEAERIARREALAQADRDTRARLVMYLMAIGAVERPPMPAPYPETPGDPPSDGATWVAGEWLWQDGAWAWQAGGWTYPDQSYSGEVEVSDSYSSDDSTPVSVERPENEDHRTESSAPPPERPRDEDHRTSSSTPAERPRSRDHRDDAKSSDDDRPKARDHRH